MQKLFRMWDPKSLQTKLSVFKRELAGNGRASFAACYVKTLRGANSPLEALFAKIMIKNKLIMALIDSGSSVDIISDTLYKQLGEPSQIRMCNKNIKAANNGKMPIMGSADIQVQLQKFTCEIIVKFLKNRTEITPCFLVMVFLYNFDCILNLRTRSLNDMVDDVVWVRVLNPEIEPKKVARIRIRNKNARIACAENVEKISRVQQNNPDNNKKHSNEFDFEKHVNSSSMSLSCEETTKVRSLCTKYEVIFSRNSNVMGFCDRIYDKIKLEKEAVPFRRTYGSMSFEKIKAMKKIVEDLERDDLVELTHSDWAAPSLLVPKKDGTYRLVVDYRGLNKQIEKTCWPLPRINEVIDSLEGNMYFSNIDLLSGYFQMALEEETRVKM